MLAAYLGDKFCDVFFTGTRSFKEKNQSVLDVLDIKYITSYLNFY